MNTATAATAAGVTAATIRTWARRNVIGAVKRAGRWIIDAASLAHRIAIAARRTRKATRMDRATFEIEAHKLGIPTPMKDGGCLSIYRDYQQTGAEPMSDYDRLLIERGAAVHAAGYTPAPRQTFPHECHFCGLDARACDCH